MTKRQALKLHNGDEVVLKEDGTSIIVLQRWADEIMGDVTIEGYTRPDNTYIKVGHKEVR
jgi:hypothetical protein